MSFDPLVANPGRLEILTALAGEQGDEPSVEFVRLRERTRLTDGNLASHARRLRSAGLIEVDKLFRDGKPLTRFTLTPAGRAALEGHARRLLDAIGFQPPVRSAAASPPAREPVAEPAHVLEDDWID